ncbi:PREDICTED: chromatin accessibility complex protein 1-like [Galeopterus variegatus]|uniref:Chromatin accessibility complex protein 1-like n=1 Tax=Galeopterus variegatus TaxID=482537 RepID=A0ABM0QAM3_GALVR|nr:PREDICTED: chromatin accessibility complex protein 1-like [Galeopterus variegatus]
MAKLILREIEFQVGCSCCCLRGGGRKVAKGIIGKEKYRDQQLVSLPLSNIWVITKSSPEVISRKCLCLKASEVLVQSSPTKPSSPTKMAAEK